MKKWRRVWRQGFAPFMPTVGLEALALALQDDDPRLLQGGTVSPPPLQCVQDWPVEAACGIAFCGWQSGLVTVAEVEEFFAGACIEADLRLEELAGCRWFLNWHDRTPREEMRRLLLPEVLRELERRRLVLLEEEPVVVLIAE